MQIYWLYDLCQTYASDLNVPPAQALNQVTQSSHCTPNTPVKPVSCPRENGMCIYVSLNHNLCFVLAEVCQSGLPA